MSKKRIIKTVQDLNREPVTEVVNKSGYEKDLLARLQREEREDAAKKKQAIEDADPTNIAKKALINTETQVALQNRTRLTKLCRDVTTMTDYARNDQEMLIDNLGLPQGTPVTMSEFEQRLGQFVDGAEASGVTFSSDAKRKFELYAFVQSRRGTVIDNATLQTMLERCESLDFGITLPKVVKQATVKPTSTPTFDDISGLNAENREQRRQIMNILDDNFTTEVADTFNRWQAQLMRDYGYAMPNAVIKRALNYVTDANLNPLAEATWDRVRRVFVKNGWFPAGMLTPRENLAAYCETADLNDREVRSYIARKNMEIHESERPYAPHR